MCIRDSTDSQPFGGGDRGYSNWELSSDRANASRRELIAGGLPDDRTLRVQGLASSVLFDAADSKGAVNRRISIIVMNKEAEERLLRISNDDDDGAAANTAAPSANTARPAQDSAPSISAAPSR